MSNFVYIAASLDGYIAGKNGNLDWLTEIPNPDASDYGFSAFLEGIDAIVMGRKTFETVAGFNHWPYPKPVFVLSHSLTRVPEGYEEKATIVAGNVREIVALLKKQGYTSLYIDGGKTIQNFLEQDLIDELIITRIPVILGSGIPLFSEMDNELRFKHVKTEVLNNTLVKSTYIRDRDSIS